MNAPTPTIHDIRQAIEVLKNEQMALPNPSLAQIEQMIQHHAARTIVGTSEKIAEHKAELEMAIHAKGEAERVLARHAEIRNELARLSQDLQMAEEFERVAVAQDASRRCREAYEEYVAASKACARAFRRVLNTNAQVGHVKGVVTAPVVASLHLPAIWPSAWLPPLGVHMLDARLPFEESEAQNG